MSIRAMTYVWETAQASGTELLCLLALADFANDEGEAYPGIKRLAKKCRIGERGIQKVLRKLEESGEIKIEQCEGLKTSTGHTNKYTLVKFNQRVNYRTSLEERGEHQDTPGVNVGTPPGVNVGTPKPSVLTISKPSEEKDSAATQTPALSPSKKKTREKKDSHPNTKPILTAYAEAREAAEPGCVIHYGAEGVAAKKLAEKGWTPEQVTECFNLLKQETFWFEKPLHLATIADQIAAKLKGGKTYVNPNCVSSGKWESEIDVSDFDLATFQWGQ